MVNLRSIAVVSGLLLGSAVFTSCDDAAEKKEAKEVATEVVVEEVVVEETAVVADSTVVVEEVVVEEAVEVAEPAKEEAAK